MERMSPWDLEPIPDAGMFVNGTVFAMSWRNYVVFLISTSGTQEESDASASGVDSNNIPISEEEHAALVTYTSQENEWPDEPYDASVERLTRGLSLISELPFAGPFAYPVDVRSYPDYWSVVAYPIDLKAIIDRLANKYYRYQFQLQQ